MCCDNEVELRVIEPYRASRLFGVRGPNLHDHGNSAPWPLTTPMTFEHADYVLPR